MKKRRNNCKEKTVVFLGFCVCRIPVLKDAGYYIYGKIHAWLRNALAFCRDVFSVNCKQQNQSDCIVPKIVINLSMH